MAYSSHYKRECFEKDCSLLIKAVTKYKEDEENFQICMDFALSNLLYHSYLEVNSHQVNRSISGLHEKYLIHSDLEKASAFKNVSEQLTNAFNKKYGDKKEVSYSVLSLLLHLSNSSDSECLATSEATSIVHNDEETDCIDWATYLREDEDKYVFSDTSSEIFTSEEDSVEEIETEFLRPPPRDDSGLGISPDSCSGSSQQQFHVNNVYLTPSVDDNTKTLDAVQQNIFYPYWNPKYQQSFTSNPYKLITMNFTKAWEEHMIVQNSFPSIVKKVLMHERNIIKEILWMLSGMKDLYLFHWNGCQFIVNPVVHTCNLTSASLSSSLKGFCEYGGKVISLQNFVNKALLDDPINKNFCRTFHTYVAVLQKQIQTVIGSFCDLEKRLRRRSETFTLLNLQEKCKPILYDLDTIYFLNQDILESIPADCGSYEKACRLLNILWENLSCISLREQTSSSTKIVLTLFLETCKPFFSFLESLIIHGNFEDPYGEFFCTRITNIHVSDTDFWENALVLKDLPIAEDFFLKPFFKDIIVAGKSIEILNKMNSLLKIEPFRLHVEKGELYSKFIHVLKLLFVKNSSSKSSVDYIPNIQKKDENTLRDPMLIQKIFEFQPSTGKFFFPGVNPVYLPIVKQSPEKLFTDMQIETDNTIKSLVPRKLKPLNVCIIRAFDTCMKYAYYPTCKRLVKALKERYNLMTHINIMQKYFLMESGDLMFSFYSKVFEKVFYNEPWQDVSFLYCVLQNAVSDDKENCESLCVFLDPSIMDIPDSPLNHLNALQLSYDVEWPTSIMLGNNVQNQYCHIFSFLLQIKCAKYLLDELYFIKLYTDTKEPQSKLASLVSKFVFPRKQKIHGMYILRMRLLYFVNGLHNYIMARILHSFGLEFNEMVENADTVDEMIVAHNHYLKSLHERCFLDRRLPRLKEQIVQVLNLCYSFQQLWLKGVDAISLEELENIEILFSQYSSFLFSYFNTPLRRGVYLHLESLVSSMLSDTHNLHIFKNTKGIPASCTYDRLNS